MNWLWAQQISAITRLELKRFLLARRWPAVYTVAFAPVLMAFLRARFAAARSAPVNVISFDFANLFQLFNLRFGIFISCAVIFSQLFRGDILEKTLHLYLLTPVRREIIAVGKYLAAVILVAVLFSASTIATHLLIYSSSSEFSSFFFEGPGVSHLIGYVTVTILATIAYGATFLLIGLLFKNPGMPAFFLLAWESLNFALPSMLQKLSVIYYLQALLPVTVDRGPFAVVTEPTSPVIGIPILLIATMAVLAVAGWFVRLTQVTYSAD
jgi:hypothetical protein